jgi:hypothetical protein
MIIPQPRPPTLWPPSLRSTEHLEPLDRALEELVHEDQWIADLIKRLNYAIADAVRKK